MDAIRNTGLWLSTFVVATSCALGWPSSQYGETLQIAPAHDFDTPRESTRRLAAIQRTLDELDRRLEMASHTHLSCEGSRDRARHATPWLGELRRDKAVIERRILETKVAVVRGRRIVISAACLDNPLAKGCM